GYGRVAVRAFAERLERDGGHRRSVRRRHLRRPPAFVGADRWRRQGLNACAGIGCIEVDDVAQQDLAVVELVPPDDNGLEGKWALAQPRDHGLAAGLDALGNGDLALARNEFHQGHFAQVHAYRVVCSLGGYFGPGFGRNRPLLDCGGLVLAFSFLLPLLRGRHLFLKPSLSGLDHVDAHLAELRQDVFDLLGIDFFRSQQCLNLVVGDITAFHGGADQLLDGRAGKVQQRGLATLFLRHLLLLWRYVDLACHESPIAYPGGNCAGSLLPLWSSEKAQSPDRVQSPSMMLCLLMTQSGHWT